MDASLEQDFRCDVATNSAIDEIFGFHTQMFSYIAQDNMKRERFGNLPWRQFPIRGMLGREHWQRHSATSGAREKQA